ncbi:hypothetical protein RJT34_30891 [Clitoria ternatea]|uniref:C2H2-type domain-containing protein n=1 Tax=Clitoria ternatea TaxID=43366 RepID=A0AAN9I0U9_CLITE
MAAGIGLLSLTQIYNLSQSPHHHQNQPNPNSITTLTSSSLPSSTTTWMWNPREQQKDQEDDSWEVRAFAEDTRNIMGTTWPPRSYTCTFCRREFRSAQALGGHMNVHRRDRARLHQASSPNYNPISSLSHPSSSSFFNISQHHHHHSQELVANGLCLLYHLPSPNNSNNAPFSSNLSHTTTSLNNACGELPSTLLSVSSYPPNNNLLLMPPNFPLVRQGAQGISGFSSYSLSSSKVEEERPTTTTSSINHGHHEELDLELRLGNRSTPS